MTKEADTGKIKADAKHYFVAGYRAAIHDLLDCDLFHEVPLPRLKVIKCAFEKYWEEYNKESSNPKELWEVDIELEELGLK